MNEIMSRVEREERDILEPWPAPKYVEVTGTLEKGSEGFERSDSTHFPTFNISPPMGKLTQEPVPALPDPGFYSFDADREGIRLFIGYSLPGQEPVTPPTIKGERLIDCPRDTYQTAYSGLLTGSGRDGSGITITRLLIHHSVASIYVSLNRHY